jgi:hypothetical protein
MIEEIKKEIDGVEYMYVPMAANAARALYAKLLKNFGPAVAQGLQDMERVKNIDMDSSVGAIIANMFGPIGKALETFTRELDPKFYEYLVDTLLRRVSCTVDGEMFTLESKVRDLYFARKFLTECKVLMFCLEAQYDDFFGLLKITTRTGITARAKANEELRSICQRISTGLSSE